jgi:hypothetical protein
MISGRIVSGYKMNIFVLDLNPELAARYHSDKHVVKMIVESAQILCTVLNKKGIKETPYKPTHQNHPCVLWAEKSYENFCWLTELLRALLIEYTFRYHKAHKTLDVYEWIDGFINNTIKELNWKGKGLTPFALAMPDEYKIPNDTVESYRQYYLKAKKDICKWKNGDIPEWWKNEK